ncbi:hypothetical protein [Rhizobium sp. NFR03]|uniref:hypothetical protein n=1 Tax=Rhizobium sp. NFR03 TaxID=1566263 RepID=UPI0008B4E05A|nr:hypothetical protein [Rhizobium sp. NFR03]SES27264.1 hypothetical protein SAMN03159406_03145 [Rhizobium sp. NFR03]
MTNENEQLANNAGLGSGDITEPAALDVERQPQPDKAPETTSNRNTVPPVRMGQASEAPETPTEADMDDNPVHHTGHIPAPVTSNR